MKYRMLSVDEFEYEVAMGNTQDSIVWGLGLVEWKPDFMLTPGSYISSSPFNPMLASSSLYLQPRWMMTIDEDKGVYQQALEDEIQEALTDGKSFWDINTNTIFPLPDGSNLSVNIDNTNNVRITTKINTEDGFQRFETRMSLEYLMNALSRSPTNGMNSSMNQSFTINSNSEYGINIQRTNSIDYGYYSKKARKISGLLNAAQYPFLQAEKRMYLYRKIPSSGGTTRIFPLEKRVPQWAGKYGGKLIVPRLGTIGINVTNSSIIKTSNYLKWGGRAIGLGGVILGGADILTNGLNFSNGLHTGMAVVALIPGGQGIAGVYFLIDAGTTLFTGQGIGEHIDEWIKQENNEYNNAYENSKHIFIDSPIKVPSLPMNSNDLIGDSNLNTF